MPTSGLVLHQKSPLTKGGLKIPEMGLLGSGITLFWLEAIAP